jgi:hypothetical protein
LLQSIYLITFALRFLPRTKTLLLDRKQRRGSIDFTKITNNLSILYQKSNNSQSNLSQFIQENLIKGKYNEQSLYCSLTNVNKSKPTNALPHTTGLYVSTASCSKINNDFNGAEFCNSPSQRSVRSYLMNDKHLKDNENASSMFDFSATNELTNAFSQLVLSRNQTRDATNNNHNANNAIVNNSLSQSSKCKKNLFAKYESTNPLDPANNLSSQEQQIVPQLNNQTESLLRISPNSHTQTESKSLRDKNDSRLQVIPDRDMSSLDNKKCSTNFYDLSVIAGEHSNLTSFDIDSSLNGSLLTSNYGGKYQSSPINSSNKHINNRLSSSAFSISAQSSFMLLDEFDNDKQTKSSNNHTSSENSSKINSSSLIDVQYDYAKCVESTVDVDRTLNESLMITSASDGNSMSERDKEEQISDSEVSADCSSISNDG